VSMITGEFKYTPVPDREIRLSPTNPKDGIGATKIPFHLWPEVATIHGSLALLDGALKYGRANFRAIGVRSSIYYDAARRHLNAWFEGENVDPDSGLHHLGHALACIAIVLESEARGNLQDDRNIPGGYRATIDALTAKVSELKEKHKARTPHHYSLITPEPAGADPVQASISNMTLAIQAACRAHNEQIERMGAPDSRHVQGAPCGFEAKGMTPEELKTFAEQPLAALVPVSFDVRKPWVEPEIRELVPCGSPPPLDK